MHFPQLVVNMFSLKSSLKRVISSLPRELGPRTKVDIKNKEDKFYVLVPAKSDDLGSDCELAIEAVNRPSQFEIIMNEISSSKLRISMLESQVGILNGELARTSFPLFLIQMIEQVNIFEHLFVLKHFPKLKDAPHFDQTITKVILMCKRKKVSVSSKKCARFFTDPYFDKIVTFKKLDIFKEVGQLRHGYAHSFLENIDSIQQRIEHLLKFKTSFTDVENAHLGRLTVYAELANDFFKYSKSYLK